MEFWEVIKSAYVGEWRYFWKAVTHPFDFPNGFYFLILVSLAVWILEMVLPWRKGQKIIRKQFWLDSFYMFFNYFFFGILIFAVLSKTTYMLFMKLITSVGLPEHVVDLSGLPGWLGFIVFFVVYDFVQWAVHVVLHRVPFLWKFHKVHHSVEEMGFAAHLRFHFMESFVYTVAKFMLLTYIFNFDIQHATYIYFFATLIGHLNHANVGWSYGPLKYIFNNPKMHIWHHAKELPEARKYGVNFAITLSFWDYIFKTNYIPGDGRDIELGFEDVETYPGGFLQQLIYPFKDKK